MKILALDTATENCSAALLVSPDRYAREELLHKGGAERILPMVQELLATAGIALTDLDAIAFGRGPGGFTGVRLAASITQGLAFGAGVPIVGISDLHALAQRVLDLEATAAGALVCTDARMGEVYWGCYARGAGNRAEPVAEDRVGAPARVQLPGTWAADGLTVGAGTGFAAYPQLASLIGTQPVHPALRPRAAEILALAVPEVLAGRVGAAEAAVPVYLRDNVAQVGPSH
ncbi:MAG: tRNA (adenosine(37)-N6)-threonylcarbamoyltransferase complex dimerization subunit type 1 TsaB [Proteobacteria bacterium]|nr:tRNA (adenosine(37)-N6)-threonylcarbamoyltransferase complex dimerization subunit type 1 TsaB [Pseudomonadota bacterium]